MNHLKKLHVNMDKCIGCLSCSYACSAGLILMKDGDGLRTIRFAETCGETCNRCAEICSENAITLTPLSHPSDAVMFATFRLAQCPICGKFLNAAEPMIHKIRISLSAYMDSDALEWISECPSCRRTSQANRLGEFKNIL